MSDDHAAHAISAYGSRINATPNRVEDWPTSMYYRYWMHNDASHACPAHYGIRTLTHKLICYYNDPLDQPGALGPEEAVEWELFDLIADPFEVANLFGETASADIARQLYAELCSLQADVGDEPFAGADFARLLDEAQAQRSDR